MIAGSKVRGVDSANASDPDALARRLRNLREGHWPGTTVLQPQLASALKMSVSTVSSWENPESGKIPPVARLYSIATFYASRRSLEGTPHILDDDELTDDERAQRDTLFGELRDLRRIGSGRAPATDVATDNPWLFPDGAPVRILCGTLAQGDRARFAAGEDHNHMALSAYADLDSLVELWGHVRALNPNADVQFELASRLESDDLHSHLVVLGNMGWVQESVFAVPDIPIRQVVDIAQAKDGEVFDVYDHDETWRRIAGPRLAGGNLDGVVLEDVGMFVRMPSPLNPERTLTLCSGIFTRGVYGAVRILSDRRVRDRNLAFIRDRFGDADTYGFLVRVFVSDHALATPVLRIGADGMSNTLFEFSS